MKTKSLKKNAVINIIRVTSNMLFPLLIFPYISRALGPESLGKVNFASATINYFVLFASLGIPTYGAIICAKKRNKDEELKKVICELLYLNIGLTVLSYILLLGTVLVIPKYYEYRSLLFICSLNIFFTAIGMEWLYTALEEFSYITVRSIFFKFISLILIFLFVHDQDDYLVYAVILCISTTGSNILNFVYARKFIKFYPLNELNFKPHLTPILVYFTASIAATVNGNTDTVMLGFFKGDIAVGLYDFSVKIKNLLTSFITAALSVSIPRFSIFIAEKKYQDYKQLFRKVVLLTLAVSVSLSIFFVCYSKETILILGGEQYLKAQGAMIVLTLCIVVLGMTWSLGVGVLQPLGREKEYAKVLLLACLVNITLNAILIPSYGVLGASIATFVTELFNMIMFYRYTKEFLGDTLKNIGFFKILVISIASGYISLFLTKYITFPIFIQFVLSFVLFFVLYGFLLLFFHSEIRFFVRAILDKLKDNRRISF